MLPARSGAARSSAMIRFMTLEEATWVVENLNGNLAQGLTEPLQVSFATPAHDVGAPSPGMGLHGCGALPPRRPGRGAWVPTWDKGCGRGSSGGPGSFFAPGKGGTKGVGGQPGSVKVLKKGLEYAGLLPGGRWTNDENALFVGGLPA